MYAHEMIFGTFVIHQLTNARLCKRLQQLKMRKMRSSNAEQQFFPPLVWAEFCGMSRLFFFFVNDQNKMWLCSIKAKRVTDFWLPVAARDKEITACPQMKPYSPTFYLDEDRLFFGAKSNQRLLE